MDKDYKNEVVFDMRWRRLKKYQKDVLSMRYAILEEEIRRLCSALGLPQSCADNALTIAKQLVGRGFSPQALAAAALITACRMLKNPRPIEDFNNFVSDIEKMKRTLRELSTLVKTPPQLEHYVAVIVSRLNVPPLVAKSAIELMQRNRKVLQGRNPWAVAAAALWISGVDMSQLKQFASVSAIRNIARLLK
jgi:transcription initiation factor TFIIIB Brf1 subunit/transcription initiation factor TFIIB